MTKDGGDCNIPIAFFKKRGDNKQTDKQIFYNISLIIIILP